MKWPTAVDLFSGAGGLTSGLRKARFRVIAALDTNSLATETYRMNFPSVRLWQADIRDVDPQQMMAKLGIKAGDLGLMAGCPPCQGFSTVRTRRRRTVRDPRNGLVTHFVRMVEAFQPQAVMLENVPGLAKYKLFKSMLARLHRLEYSTWWDIRDAADCGVPQRRKRLILLGFTSESLTPPKASENLRVTVRDAIATLPEPGQSGDQLHDMSEKRSAKVASIIRRIPKDGGSRSALGSDQLACHTGFDGFRDVYGRMAWDDVAPTITGGCVNPSKGRFLHPECDRCITIREALLLQGFPKDFQLSLRRGKFAAAEMVGNAMPPPFVAHYAAMLRPTTL